MLDQAAINRLNQHPTSKQAEAEMKRLQPDWYLSESPNNPTDGLALLALLQALAEEQGNMHPAVMEREWLETVKFPSLTEMEAKVLLDRVDVSGTLEDVTGSLMEAIREIESEKPEDEQETVPDFWP